MTESMEFDRNQWRVLYQKYMVDKLPLEKISSEEGHRWYDESKSSPGLNSRLRELEIPAYKKIGNLNPLSHVKMTERQEEILIGSILGDAHLAISKGGATPYYREEHSLKQLEYLQWKADELYPFVGKVACGHKGKSCVIRSKHVSQLGFYHKVFYGGRKGTKRIPLDSLNWITPLSVAVWYMDDGSRHSKNGTVSIATHSFTVAENVLLSGWFMGKHDIRFKVQLDRKYAKLRLMGNDNQKFFDLVSHHIHSSMMYKLGQ